MGSLRVRTFSGVHVGRELSVNSDTPAFSFAEGPMTIRTTFYQQCRFVCFSKPLMPESVTFRMNYGIQLARVGALPP